MMLSTRGRFLLVFVSGIFALVEGLLYSFLRRSSPIGIPIYIWAETMIPIGALPSREGSERWSRPGTDKIGGAGASIPELTLLSAIFEKKLLAAFVLTIFGIAVATGYLAKEGKNCFA
jgi:uncharacterized membrane protein YraQ (UPF0718 family)